MKIFEIPKPRFIPDDIVVILPVDQKNINNPIIVTKIEKSVYYPSTNEWFYMIKNDPTGYTENRLEGFNICYSYKFY